MVGPLAKAPGGFEYLFVAIDKFSKWIEYMPLVKATSDKAVEFLDNIVHRFGIPNCIITDLGTQFTGSKFWDYCEERSITVKYVSVAHPRANGQVERANGMILDALKKRLYQANKEAPGRWLEELPSVVWGLRTQPSRNTGVSPYYMVYGAEAVLPSDVAFQSPRVTNYDEISSFAARQLDVDCLEEQRLDSCVRTAKYLDVLRRYYNKNIRERLFAVGDLVLKWKTGSDPKHKLSSPWDGPYIIKEVTRPTSYRLMRLDGTDVPNSWHINNLRRFYA